MALYAIGGRLSFAYLRNAVIGEVYERGPFSCRLEGSLGFMLLFSGRDQLTSEKFQQGRA